MISSQLHRARQSMFSKEAALAPWIYFVRPGALAPTQIANVQARSGNTAPTLRPVRRNLDAAPMTPPASACSMVLATPVKEAWMIYTVLVHTPYITEGG